MIMIFIFSLDFLGIFKNFLEFFPQIGAYASLHFASLKQNATNPPHAFLEKLFPPQTKNLEKQSQDVGVFDWFLSEKYLNSLILHGKRNFHRNRGKSVLDYMEKPDVEQKML